MYRYRVWPALLGLCFSTLAVAGDAPKAVATVNGQAVPQAHLEFLVKARVAAGTPDTPELRENLRDYLISRELLEQEAVRRGLDRDENLKTQFELSKESLLVAALLQKYDAEHLITDEQLKAEYERQKAELGSKEYLALHILVSDEAEAKRVIAQLKEGAEFETLARSKSLDERSKASGGELGWAAPMQLVDPLAKEIRSLKKGEYSRAPVQTEHGWHVVKVKDERSLDAPPFEQVKQTLAQSMKRKQVDDYIASLRKKATIE